MCYHFKFIIHGIDIKGAQSQDAEGTGGAPVCLRGCYLARRKNGWEGTRVGTPGQSAPCTRRSGRGWPPLRQDWELTKAITLSPQSRRPEQCLPLDGDSITAI